MEEHKQQERKRYSGLDLYEGKGRIELTDRENGKRRGRPAQLYRLKEE